MQRLVDIHTFHCSVAARSSHCHHWAEQRTRYDPSIIGTQHSPRTPIQANVPYRSAAERQRDDEYSVECPHRCGAVLTGVHALGNLTRHLKSEACSGSGQAKVKFPCPIQGCVKKYARSDGLRVHMRKRHGAPPAPPEDRGR